MWRHALSRSSRGALAGLLSVAIVGVSAPGALAARSTPEVVSATGKASGTADDTATSALVEAKRTGKPVELVAERSERATVFANPDGVSFTAEQSTVPVRVAKEGGGWQTPDATLVRWSDGTVGPRAATADVRFSGGGGESPLATIADEGRSLSLSWPGTLPKPELDGATALYPEVLPGVDLQVNATVESFQHLLVVKTPEAAEDPRLKKVSFGLRTEGLTVRQGPAGNLTAVDANGATVFRAPPAQMWNSAGKAAAAKGQKTAPRRAPALAGSAHAAAAPLTAQEIPGDTAENNPSGKGMEPGQGDRVVRMDVRVTKDALAVTPDTSMLTEAKGTDFPLFIDPNVTWGESERTLLRSDGYESYGWGNGDDNLGKGAGKCGTWNGYYCGPGYVQRLYYEFSPAELKGKQVLDATFRVTEPWAFQCSPRWVDLVRTNNISSSTTWASRPKELDLMVDRNVSAGRGSLCDPDSPDAAIEFRDNPEETNENLTPTVRDFAAGKFSRLTLQIRAHDESDTSAWKRFRNDAVLSVKFVALPALPTGVGLVSGNGTVCSTQAADPDIISDPTPLVTGKPRTASGGESGASLRIRWRTQRLDGGTWVTAHTDVDSPTSGYVGNLVTQSKSLPKLSEGVRYRLLALTLSFDEKGGNRLNTGYTTPCYFMVDATAPKAPKVTLESPHTPCLPNSCVPRGRPGAPVNFAFAAADGDPPTLSYQYRLTSQEAWANAQKVCSTGTSWACAAVPEHSVLIKGGKATVKPAKSGTYRIYVRAKDSLGRWGAQSTLDFAIASGEAPEGRWHLSEADGVAVDSEATDGRDDLTLGGGAVRDDRGRRGLLTHDAQGVPLSQPVTDRGLALNGTDGHASSSARVLETDKSYTVTAWVRLDPGANRTMTVLSQTPSTASPFTQKYSPFYLSYGAGGDGTWSLRTLSKEGQFATVKAKHTASRGVWTHVAGVYDAEESTIGLYVNGLLQETAAAGTAWASDGPLQVGRVMHADVNKDYLHGSVDEPAVWQRALSEAEIKDEAKLLTSEGFAGVELMADWNPSAGSGTTVPDTTSGYGRSLTLQGGAALADEAIVLDGVDDRATTTAGPVVDDLGSFTASTLVKLDPEKLLTKSIGYTGQVHGQRTSDGSAWGFWYQLSGKDTVLDMETGLETTVPVGKWHFGRLNNDGSFSSIVSDEVASLDSEVRLTGTFDAQDGTISLYLGHNQNGDAKAYTARASSGEFALGAGFTSGAWKHHLPARIFETRLWAGAMASSAQIDEHVGD
ncbi:LamG-like jellyroll fold domain-containing protein [Streptomyces bacillaris]